MSSSSKSMRLRFKGDKVEKKKKKKSSSGSGGEKRARSKDEDAESDADEFDGNEKAWVPVERLTDLAGPAFFYQRVLASQDDDRPSWVCIAWEPLRHRVEAHPVSSSSATTLDERSAAGLVDLDGAQVVHDVGSTDGDAPSPTDVMQVWVATRVLDTPSTAPRYTLRSAEARFMTAERRGGGVSADAEARGPLEEWTLVQAVVASKRRTSSNAKHAAIFALQGAQGTFLGTDQVAGGKRVVRSDFEQSTQASSQKVDGENAAVADVETDAQWHIAVQWKFRHEARKRERGVAPLRDRDPTFKRIKHAGDGDE